MPVEMGRPKYSYEKVIAIINDLSGYLDPKKMPFIRLAEKEKLIESAKTGESFRDRIWSDNRIKGPALFIVGSIWGLLEWIWQQIRKG